MSFSPVFDVAIVGTGPAGAACAYHLAKAGVRVVLLEKESLPREKPCGGGVSPEVQGWFPEVDFSPVISHTVRRVQFSWCGRDEVESDFGTANPLWLVRRDAFDQFLVQQALALGAELQESWPVERIQRQSDQWELGSIERQCRARFLVLAEGAKGTWAKRLGFDLQDRAIAGALEAESPAPSTDPQAVHLDFGIVPGGYAWNFPKADGQSLGLGAFRGRAPKNLRERLSIYCDRYDAPLTQCRLAGHPLALWDGDQVLHQEGVLVVGEAACLVDPFTAEGIRPAMRSGVLAAQTLLAACSSASPDLTSYTRAVVEDIGIDMAWAKRLAQAFYFAPSLAYRVGVRHPGSAARMASILTGEARYRDLAARALKRLGL